MLLSRIPLYFTAALALALAATAHSEEGPQDEVVLKDGSRVMGTVTASRDGVVTVETGFAGTIDIAVDQIAELRSSEPAQILLVDDSVLEDEPLLIRDGELIAGERTLPVEDLDVLNPAPWELGQGYNWTGLINFALQMERGNSDTDELDYKLESVWTSTRDRYTIKLRGEIDEANGEKNTDNWQAMAKWDYFLTDPNYWGMMVLAEEDKFTDLDLRYLVGPYLGRQFLDSSLLSVSGELGLSYVNEEFIVADDQDYPASNWNLRVTSDYLGGESTLYLDQLGIWNLDETSDVIVNTTLGLSFPLLFNFEAAAEILWEYDSGAVDDVDDLDETYKIRIGYTW